MPTHQQANRGRHEESDAHKKPQTDKPGAVYRPAGIDSGVMERVRLDPKQVSPAGMLQLQRTIGNRAVGQLITPSPIGAIQRDYYAYGSANTTPHIHVYRGGSHLKILDRRRIRRYNIVQNGRRHSQADDALAAAEGNQALIDAINELLDEV